MERFLNAKSGVYCGKLYYLLASAAVKTLLLIGPLKMLATEVYQKSNQRGTPCDLVTGEERKFAINPDTPSSHVSCTVEMT